MTRSQVISRREARGVELGLIHEARSRGIRTGNRHLAAIDSDTPSGWIDAGSQRPLPDDAPQGPAGRFPPHASR